MTSGSDPQQAVRSDLGTNDPMTASNVPPTRRRFVATLLASALATLVGPAGASETPAFPVHPLLRGAVPAPSPGEPLRLVHLTDAHVVADGTVLSGVDTAANLRVAIAAVNALKPRPHLVAVTGDLTLDSADGLWVFKSLMEHLQVPWFAVPGNHDNAIGGRVCETMFASVGLPRHYAFDYAGRHFICVDAEEEQRDAVRGNLSRKQVEWLRQDLKEHADMETLLFVHQHPLTDDWNTPNTFAENAPLLRAIRENPQVRWVFNGHSHDNRFLELDGARFITTSATAYVFGKPGAPWQHGSGFRSLELGPPGSGVLSSRFHALSGETFPDPPPAEFLSAERDPAAWVKAFGPDTASYKAPPEGPYLLVGLCQVPCKDGAIEENLRTVEGAVREAAARGAKVVCLPESMDLGWVNAAARSLAQPVPGPFSGSVTALARELGVYIVVGLTEKVEGGIYDAAILAGPGGSILLKHRKINNLTELGLISPPYLDGSAEDIRAIDTPLGRLGVLICADTFVDENLFRMKAQKPDLVLVPYGWAAPPAEWPGHGEELKKTVSRASRLIGAPVVGPTCIGRITSGPWTGRTYEGESVAADAEGDILFFGLTGRRQIAVFPVAVSRAGERSP